MMQEASLSGTLKEEPTTEDIAGRIEGKLQLLSQNLDKLTGEAEIAPAEKVANPRGLRACLLRCEGAVGIQEMRVASIANLTGTL